MKPNWPPPAADWPPMRSRREATEDDHDFAKGSFIIRMDQPYSRLADAMLDVQYVRSDEKVYDDTGWTLGYLKNVDFKRVANPDVLKVPMHAWDGSAAAPTPAANNADIDSRPPCLRIAGPAAAHRHPAHLAAHAGRRAGSASALESLGIPYTLHLDAGRRRRTPNLREKFDVILFPPTGGSNSSAGDRERTSRPARRFRGARPRSRRTSAASTRPTTCVPASA